jgi:hypothetical protein
MIPLAIDILQAIFVLSGAFIAILINPYWEGEE